MGMLVVDDDSKVNAVHPEEGMYDPKSRKCNVWYCEWNNDLHVSLNEQPGL